MNPALIEAIARDRQAELRGDHQQPVEPIRARASHRATSVRKATGWFLVGLGLRLAMSRQPVTSIAR
jgi:hypothetical protein